MARFHVSTNTPTKLELLEEWVPKQAWSPAASGSIESIGTFHYDDPEGEVGLQTHLLSLGGVLLQVPLSYRAVPLEGAEAALVGEMHHKVLGPRFVYDGLGDHRFVMMLAAVTLTGLGQALGMARLDDGWAAWPSEVRVAGGGWGTERVVVDGCALVGDDPVAPVFRNRQFDLIFHRRPVPASRPPIGITATWPRSGAPVVLAEARVR